MLVSDLQEEFNTVRHHVQGSIIDLDFMVIIYKHLVSNPHLILTLQSKNQLKYSTFDYSIAFVDFPSPVFSCLFGSLIYLYLSFNRLMGNANSLCGDRQFMDKVKRYEVEFNAQKPLFNIEDVVFPLSTEGIMIVDAKGRRVKLAGGNWSGAHMCRHCVDGLQMRPLRDIAMDIRYKFQMNCIRLTYSLQLYFDNKPIPAKYLTANPELIGKTGMEIFDITIRALTDVGLMVILNNHTSTSQWCCSDDDGDGLWWSREYPENMFFQCAEAFAVRYRNNPRVIGMDLRNQLRKAHGYDATWGDGNPLTDWKRAAKICSDKVLALAPHWLIFVSGLSYQVDLTRVKESPLHLSVPNKLIYTGHFYKWSWPSAVITTWNLVSYDQFKDKLFNSQTYIRGLGYPYFLGQFGCDERDIPWNYLIRYLKETDIDWTYWCLDGFKCEPEKDETYGVFTNDFRNVRHPDMLADMISVGPPPGTQLKYPQDTQSRNNMPQGKPFQPIPLQQQGPRDGPVYHQPPKIQISQQGRMISALQPPYQQQEPRHQSPRFNYEPQRNYEQPSRSYEPPNNYEQPSRGYFNQSPQPQYGGHQYQGNQQYNKQTQPQRLQQNIGNTYNTGNTGNAQMPNNYPNYRQ